MKIGFAHWVAAFLIALLLHALLFAEMRTPETTGGEPPGATTLDIAFADIAPPQPEPVVEAEPEAAAEPEPLPEQEPEPEPVPQPEPIPEPEPVVEPVAEPEPPPPPPKPKPKPVVKPKPKPKVKLAATTPASDRPQPPSRPSAAAPSTARAQPAPPAVSGETADRYGAQLLRRLEQKKHYPRSALLRRKQGTVELRLKIGGDGRLVDAHIVTPSGHQVLDEAALTLAQQASPFPPPPAGASRPYEVIVPLVYRLR